MSRWESTDVHAFIAALTPTCQTVLQDSLAVALAPAPPPAPLSFRKLWGETRFVPQSQGATNRGWSHFGICRNKRPFTTLGGWWPVAGVEGDKEAKKERVIRERKQFVCLF